MSSAPSAGTLRADLRRKTILVVTVAVGLAALDLVLIPLGVDWHTVVVLAAVVVEASLVTLAGGWILRRPLLLAIDELESRAAAAEEQSADAERLASAGRVAAGLAHEVGNPLCAITNYAHSLEDKVAPELRDTVRSLQREASRIERIMNGFTDHTRPREPGSLGADVNEALQETLSFLGDQGVLRRIAVGELLEEGPLPVSGQALELEQVFANLLLNAADAMPGGGRLVLCTQRAPRDALVNGLTRRAGDDRTSLRTRRRDERLERWVGTHLMEEVVMIVVADSGLGVTRGEEERIFEPFVTSKPADQGSGIGLAVVRRLVDGMGGMVWVEPSREGGAAFRVVLPIFTPGLATAR